MQPYLGVEPVLYSDPSLGLMYHITHKHTLSQEALQV